jgi:hypothetical protein
MGYELPDELGELVQIDEMAINVEFTTIAAHFAYYNERYAEAVREYLHAERERKLQHARLSLVKRELLAKGDKKPTEGTVTASVETDEVYQAAYVREIDAEASKERLRGVLEALRTKREMLVSLGAQLRVEMQGDPLLRAERAANRR